MSDHHSSEFGRATPRLTRRRALMASGMAAATMAAGTVAGGRAAASSIVFPAARGDLRAAQDSTPAAGGSLPEWEPRFDEEVTLRRFGFGTDNITSDVRVKAFQETYPNFKLEVTPEVTDQKILTAVASGDVPDLFWLGSETIQSWAARGALEPLDDLIENDDRFDLGQFYDSEITKVQYDGPTYGVPQFVDCRPLWLNGPPLEEVGIAVEDVDPSNWQQMQDYGVELLKKDGDQIVRWGFDTKGADFFWMWSWGNGGDLLTDEGRTATFDTPENLEALQYNIDTYDAQGGFQVYQAFIQTTGFEGEQNFFVQNQVAMTPFESWLLGIIAEGDPDHQFTVVPFRGKDGQAYSITGGQSWAIPKGAKNKEAAWEWISYFSSPTIWVQTSQTIKQQLEDQGTSYVPSLTASKTANELLRDRVFTGTGQESFDNAVKLFPDLLDANKQAAVSPVLKEINDIVINTVAKPALNGEKSAEEALKEGQQKAQQALDDFFK